MSDLHGYLPPEVPRADLVLIAGDICPDVHGSATPGMRTIAGLRPVNWLRDVFALWLDRLDAPRIVMCWGNHDYAGELRADLLPPLRADILTDREISIDGLRIYGSPWTFTMPGVWAFDVNPDRLAQLSALIPVDVDILLTHGPPLGVLDRVASGEQVGSASLAASVRRTRPGLRVFGHIHEARGRQESSYNVSVLDERYRPYAMGVTTIEL